jgi:hypothetical protein
VYELRKHLKSLDRMQQESCHRLSEMVQVLFQIDECVPVPTNALQLHTYALFAHLSHPISPSPKINFKPQKKTLDVMKKCLRRYELVITWQR